MTSTLNNIKELFVDDESSILQEQPLTTYMHEFNIKCCGPLITEDEVTEINNALNEASKDITNKYAKPTQAFTSHTTTSKHTFEKILKEETKPKYETLVEKYGLLENNIIGNTPFHEIDSDTYDEIYKALNEEDSDEEDRSYQAPEAFQDDKGSSDLEEASKEYSYLVKLSLKINSSEAEEEARDLIEEENRDYVIEQRRAYENEQLINVLTSQSNAITEIIELEDQKKWSPEWENANFDNLYDLSFKLSKLRNDTYAVIGSLEGNGLEYKSNSINQNRLNDVDELCKQAKKLKQTLIESETIANRKGFSPIHEPYVNKLINTYKDVRYALYVFIGSSALSKHL